MGRQGGVSFRQRIPCLLLLVTISLCIGWYDVNFVFVTFQHPQRRDSVVMMEGSDGDEKEPPSRIPYRLLVTTPAKHWNHTSKTFRQRVQRYIVDPYTTGGHPHQPHETEILFLSEKDCIRLLQLNYPSMLKHFFQRLGSHRSHICRLAALDHYGGITLDTSTVILRVIQPWAPPSSSETNADFVASTSGTGTFQTEFLASRQQHPILRQTLFEMERLLRQKYYQHDFGTKALERGYHKVTRRVRSATLFLGHSGGTAPADTERTLLQDELLPGSSCTLQSFIRDNTTVYFGIYNTNCTSAV